MYKNCSTPKQGSNEKAGEEAQASRGDQVGIRVDLTLHLILLSLLMVLVIPYLLTSVGGPGPTCVGSEQFTVRQHVCQEATDMSIIEIYRTFMHRDPDRTFPIEVPYSTRGPRQLAMLGKLRELGGEVDGYDIHFPWASKAGALLLASGEGILFAYDPSCALQRIERLQLVAYECDKGKGNHVYVHEFKPAVRLSLVPGSKGCLGRITGRYRIDSDGIV